MLSGKEFEMSNHLGNCHGCWVLSNKTLTSHHPERSVSETSGVLAVVTDRKVPIRSGSTNYCAFFLPNVVSYSDYYPFGMQMPQRNDAVSEYRYGFNGMEGDSEVKGQGNSYTTEFRQYDPRLGRWLSVDPLAFTMAYSSPYTAFANSPIYYIDPNGLKPTKNRKKSAPRYEGSKESIGNNSGSEQSKGKRQKTKNNFGSSDNLKVTMEMQKGKPTLTESQGLALELKVTQALNLYAHQEGEKKFNSWRTRGKYLGADNHRFRADFNGIVPYKETQRYDHVVYTQNRYEHNTTILYEKEKFTVDIILFIREEEKQNISYELKFPKKDELPTHYGYQGGHCYCVDFTPPSEKSEFWSVRIDFLGEIQYKKFLNLQLKLINEVYSNYMKMYYPDNKQE